MLPEESIWATIRQVIAVTIYYHLDQLRSIYVLPGSVLTWATECLASLTWDWRSIATFVEFAWIWTDEIAWWYRLYVPIWQGQLRVLVVHWQKSTGCLRVYGAMSCVAALCLVETLACNWQTKRKPFSKRIWKQYSLYVVVGSGGQFLTWWDFLKSASVAIVQPVPNT